MSPERGDLVGTEPHPAIHSALEYYNNIPPDEFAKCIEALASCGIEGNRLGEVCCATLERLKDKSLKVSDRYLLGLVWTLRDLIEKDHQQQIHDLQLFIKNLNWNTLTEAQKALGKKLVESYNSQYEGT